MKTKEKSKGPAANHSKESLRTWLRLLSCETVIEQHLRTLLRQNFSITLPQFDVLSELERAGDPLTMSQLSKELMVSNGNVTGVIDRLEKTGFAKRVRAEHDRRVQYIELTAKGTIRNKEVFNRKHYERIQDVDPATFTELIDVWVIEFAELFAMNQ